MNDWMDRATFSLVLMIGLMHLTATMNAQTDATWERQAFAHDEQNRYSEVWTYKDCRIFVLKDGNGLEILTHQENYIDPSFIPFIAMHPDIYDTPWTLEERLTITRDSVGAHKTLSASESTYSGDRFSVDAPDLFSLHCRDAAHSLPSNVKTLFHFLYGIEP
jgi:hypothetical protein